MKCLRLVWNQSVILLRSWRCIFLKTTNATLFHWKLSSFSMKTFNTLILFFENSGYIKYRYDNWDIKLQTQNLSYTYVSHNQLQLSMCIGYINQHVVSIHDTQMVNTFFSVSATQHTSLWALTNLEFNFLRALADRNMGNGDVGSINMGYYNLITVRALKWSPEVGQMIFHKLLR